MKNRFFIWLTSLWRKDKNTHNGNDSLVERLQHYYHDGEEEIFEDLK